MLWFAGQIGLDPATMTLVSNEPLVQVSSECFHLFVALPLEQSHTSWLKIYCQAFSCQA